MPPACTTCGSSLDCRQAFDALLALEHVHPTAFGAVHHLTVACYSLQHPEGYAAAAIASWRRIVADVLDGRVTIPGLRRGVGAQFEGPTRVREPGARSPDWWPRRWPLTAPDVVPAAKEPSTAEGHVTRVLAWAASVRETIDAAERRGRHGTAHTSA